MQRHVGDEGRGLRGRRYGERGRLLSLASLLFVLFFLLVAACATPGEHFPVSLSYEGEPPLLPRQGPVEKVLVFPFQDQRSEGGTLGRRTHFFGQVDTFEADVRIGQKAAQLLVTSLRQRGWEASLAPEGLSPHDVMRSAGDRGSVHPDRVVTGTIQTLWAEAVSHLGYTEIDAHLVLNVEVLDPKTGGKTTLKIENQNVPKVVFFRPESLQETLNGVLSEGVNRVRP